MNIAMFSDTYEPQVNGVVTMIKMLEEQLTGMGHNVYIFTVDHTNAVYKENVYRMHSLKWPWERQHRMGIPTDYKDVVKYVKEWKIDIIHTHTSIVLGYVGNIIADLHNIPNVTTYHTMMVEYMHYVPFIEPLLKVYIKGENKRFCNKNRAVIAPSIKIKKLLLDYGVTVPVEVVPNGVDLAPFKHEYPAAEIEDFRSEYGIGRDDKLIIFVGRLGEEKSIDKLLENFSKTVEKVETAHFMLVGDGPNKEKLKDYARTLGVGDRVHFTGYLKWPLEISLAYHSSDMFIIASHTETFGLVTLEAIASGLPVVAYDDASIYGMVIDGENGYLCPTKDSLYPKMIEVLQDDGRRKIMTGKSVKISENFSAEENAKKTLDLYYRVLNGEL